MSHMIGLAAPTPRVTWNVTIVCRVCNREIWYFEGVPTVAKVLLKIFARMCFWSRSAWDSEWRRDPEVRKPRQVHGEHA
jgi:hypothetical protein